VKLLRIMRVNRVFRRWENMYSINYSVFGLYCYIAFVFASTHWFACFYHLVKFVENGSTSWVSASGSTDTWDTYVFALHWATQTISSIGYGDVGPVTTAERMFITIFMFIGGVIFAFALGEICGAVQSLGKKQAEYHQCIDDFNNFADEVKLPNEMSKRVREYFKHKYNNNTLSETGVTDILDQFTDQLKMEIALYIHTDWIKSVPFFMGCPEEFVVNLAVSMKIRTFTPREAIYSPGDEANEFYIVKKGMAASKGVIYGKLKAFGVDMLHGLVHRPVERASGCRSIAFTDVYMLEYPQFMASCKRYPMVLPKIMAVAIKFMFIQHIMAFSKACMNFASGMTGFTNDLLVMTMEKELENKRHRKPATKANKFHEVRDSYARELRKMTKVLDSIKRSVHRKGRE